MIDRSADHRLFRAVSSLAALLAVAAVWLAEAYRPEAGTADRIALAAVLVGGIGGAVHGLGWQPSRRPLTWICTPYFVWPTTVAAAIWLLAA